MDAYVTEVDESVREFSDFLSEWKDDLIVVVESVQDGDVQMPYREFAQHCSRLEIMELIGRIFATEVIESHLEDHNPTPANVFMRFAQHLTYLKTTFSLNESEQSVSQTKLAVIDRVLEEIVSIGWLAYWTEDDDNLVQGFMEFLVEKQERFAAQNDETAEYGDGQVLGMTIAIRSLQSAVQETKKQLSPGQMAKGTFVVLGNILHGSAILFETTSVDLPASTVDGCLDSINLAMNELIDMGAIRIGRY